MSLKRSRATAFQTTQTRGGGLSPAELNETQRLFVFNQNHRSTETVLWIVKSIYTPKR